MDFVNPYILIIVASLVVILSYFFNSISRKTSIPSVLLLIILGVILQQGIVLMGMDKPDVFGILEILGIVGLIMIVLEAALDLELRRSKWPIIWRSFGVSLVSLGLCAFLIAFAIQTFMKVDLFVALVYAIPVSIMSSAIVIPSVAHLDNDNKEFMVYESTFSDILGIMFFYFLLGSMETEGAGEIWTSIAINVGATIIISIAVSYGLILLFQNLQSKVKLFLLIAILLLLYAAGKMFHLSSLLIILVFGLVLHNHKLFFFGILHKWKKQRIVEDILADFKLITAESAFIIRTFFFVIFGISISLSYLVDLKVLFISLVILAILFAVRFVVLKIFLWKGLFPRVLIAPRGLITILLYFGIPEELRVDDFRPGILLYIILISSVIMTVALIREKNKKAASALEPISPPELIEGEITTE